MSAFESESDPKQAQQSSSKAAGAGTISGASSSSSSSAAAAPTTHSPTASLQNSTGDQVPNQQQNGTQPPGGLAKPKILPLVGDEADTTPKSNGQANEKPNAASDVTTPADGKEVETSWEDKTLPDETPG